MNTAQQTTSKTTTPSPIVYTSCSLLEAAAEMRLEQARLAAAAGTRKKAGSKPASKRWEVKVGGKRVKTIDVHAHVVIPETVKMCGGERNPGPGPFRPGIEEVGEQRIREMDAMGIDVEVLSINPHWYKTDKDTAAEVVRINNERLAEFCAKYPDRITAFCSVALQFPELAAEQLQYAVKKLGLKGPAVGASVPPDDFSHPKFHVFWRKCQDLGAVTFIHPQSTPQLHERLKGNGWLANTIGNPLDTTICLEHLIFEGTLDRFPKLKLISAHGGGFLPSYAPRMDHACRVNPWECNPKIKLKKKPTQYLRQMYFDTLVFTSEALRHLAAEVGVSQLMIGTDHPIPWHPHPVEHIMNAPFNNAEKIAMLGGNAAKLLKIK